MWPRGCGALFMQTFKLSLAEVLRWEGGYVNHPRDKGGPTNHGITQATYDAWRKNRGLEPRSVRRILTEEVERIYHERYWVPAAAYWEAAGHPGIALYVFDGAVQHGVEGIKELEEKVGEVLHLHPLLGLAQLHSTRTFFYARLPHFDRFGRGWMRRAAYMYAKAVAVEHPKGRIRAHRFFLDGNEYPLAKASWVGEKLYVRRA